MNTPHTLTRIISGTLLSGGVAVAGFGLSAGTAHALPRCEVPYGCWCPGQPLPQTAGPITWDMNVCHNYHYSLLGGHGDLISPPPGFCPPHPFSDNKYDPC
jgi:hypothetical protein